jgi:hypothetical protein
MAEHFLIPSGTSKLYFTGVIEIYQNAIYLTVNFTNELCYIQPPATRMSISSFADFLHRIVLADFLL